MNRYSSLIIIFVITLNTIFLALLQANDLPDGVFGKFKEYIGESDVPIDGGNMRRSLLCADNSNYCWILTPRNPLVEENVDVINIYINRDLNEATGRMGLIDGADWRIMADIRSQRVVVEQYDNIPNDVPLSEYGGYIHKTEIPRDAWEMTFQEGLIMFTIRKDIFNAMPFNGSSQYYTLVYTGDKVACAGVFSSDRPVEVGESPQR